MSWQVITSPGSMDEPRCAIWSTVSDAFVLYGATPERARRFYLEQRAIEADAEWENLLSGRPRRGSLESLRDGLDLMAEVHGPEWITMLNEAVALALDDNLSSS